MTVHNSCFSLGERVVTFVDTKYSIYTLLPSSLLQLPCLSDTHVTHHSPPPWTQKQHAPLWCLSTPPNLQVDILKEKSQYIVMYNYRRTSWSSR